MSEYESQICSRILVKSRFLCKKELLVSNNKINELLRLDKYTPFKKTEQGKNVFRVLLYN